MRERPELAREHRECFGRVEVADENRRRIVGMEELLVVLAQLGGGHPLDVRAITDRRPVIGVGHDRRADHRFVERLGRVVLADLVFIAHDTHFGLALGIEQQRAAEAVRFDLHRQLDTVRRQGRVASHAIEPRGHVRGAEVCASFREHFLERRQAIRLAEVLGALVEEQVLE